MGMEMECRTEGSAQALTRLPLDDWIGYPVEGGSPVRQPAAYRGQWSKPGYFWMAAVRGHVRYESQLEAWALLELDFQGTVAQILPQPCRIDFDRTSKPYRHIPDYLVQHHDGSRELIDVKGATAAAKSGNQKVFRLTGEACGVLGWRYRLAHEPDDAYYRNVHWLSTARRWSTAEMGASVEKLAEHVRNGDARTWDDAVVLVRSWGGSESAAIPIVMSAVWDRSVQADLTVPLRGDTRLSWNPGLVGVSS